MFLVDSHCHFNLLDLSPDAGDLNNIITRAKENGVGYFLNVCVDIVNFPSVLKTAETYPFVGASVGLHPNEQSEEVTTDTLIKLGQHEKVVAIGETGLDYFRTEENQEWQIKRFRAHIAAAKVLNKPLIIHTRAAKMDTLRVMREEKADEIAGVMHCFSEDWEIAKQALDMNFYISFSGIVTFKSAVVMQEVAKRVPLNRLLIETDAPYLAPVPHRGKANEPAFVRYTAEKIAELRQISLNELGSQTTDNFFSLFQTAVRPHD